ncbi:MAG: hypothetical protein PUP92_06425 [Rhizonema sp. PD38]|nr:hypothetical protein [Rhizonema sp. PD38]
MTAVKLALGLLPPADFTLKQPAGFIPMTRSQGLSPRFSVKFVESVAQDLIEEVQAKLETLIL